MWIQGMLLIGSPGEQTINGGVPFTDTPDSISAYAKYDKRVKELVSELAFPVVGKDVSKLIKNPCSAIEYIQAKDQQQELFV